MSESGYLMSESGYLMSESNVSVAEVSNTPKGLAKVSNTPNDEIMGDNMKITQGDVLYSSNLTADKRGQTDLFTCDVADAVLKDLMPTLEHPFYSLSKKPLMTDRIYRRGDNWLKVSPSAKGMATIYDKD